MQSELSSPRGARRDSGSEQRASWCFSTIRVDSAHFVPHSSSLSVLRPHPPTALHGRHMSRSKRQPNKLNYNIQTNIVTIFRNTVIVLQTFSFCGVHSHVRLSREVV